MAKRQKVRSNRSNQSSDFGRRLVLLRVSLFRSLAIISFSTACSTPGHHHEAARTLKEETPGTYLGTAVEIDSEMGNETSYFTRVKAVGEKEDQIFASQLRLVSGATPNLTVSWPAGNEGVYLKFNPQSAKAKLEAMRPPTAISRPNSQRGIQAALRAFAPGGPVEMTIEQISEGPMRQIRDSRDYHSETSTIDVQAKKVGEQLVAERDSIDHLTHYVFKLRPLRGTELKFDEKKDQKRWSLHANSEEEIEFEIEVTCDEKPLTPVPIEDVLTPEVLKNAKAHDLAELNYLIYDETLLAGADNYLTMFGRDNEFLITIGADGLKAKAFEIVIASHLEAMRADGNLAHEPAIGEYASVVSEKEGRGIKRDISYAYQMIDTRFLLAPSVARYLEKVTPEKAREFFNHKTSNGLTFKQDLLKNYQFIIASTEPFAKNPVWKNLISLEKGFLAGQWRDSNSGLAGGRYPFDVNVALAPGALSAIAESGKRLADPEFLALAMKAEAIAKVWNEKAWPLFQVTLSPAQVAEKLTAYETQLGLPSNPPEASLKNTPLTFAGISLDEVGSPIPIMNSDGGFLLLYVKNISDDRILEVIRTVILPFPSGLLSPIGMFISNGAYAPRAIRKNWGFNAYHGVVIWPWQEFLMAKGIANQLSRNDLRPETVAELKKAELALWQVIYKTAAYLSIELYSAEWKAGQLVPIAFGQSAGQDASSTIIQGWSKLSLLIQPPPRVTEKLGPMPAPTAQDRRF